MSLVDQIATETFTSWEALYRKYLADFRATSQAQLWVFRGHANGNWRLETRLEREFRKAECNASDWGYLEEGLIREFQRRLATAEDSIIVPDSSNVLAWMALMQHHGTPTRLLDWTYSFFVALFFAVETADEDAAVWAIDVRWCNRQSRQRLPNPDNVDTKIARDPFVTTSVTFKNLFARNPEIPLVYRVNPFVLNTRLAVQQGLFLCPGSVSKRFEDNLEALLANDRSPSKLHKWVIAKCAHKEVLRELSYMNIGRHSLFPGIDGFAQSLTQFLKTPERLFPSWRRKQMTDPYENWSNWDAYSD